MSFTSMRYDKKNIIIKTEVHRSEELSKVDKFKLEHFILSFFRRNPIFAANPNLVLKNLFYLNRTFHKYLVDRYSDKALQIAIFTIRKKYGLYGMELFNGNFIRIKK